MLAPSMSRLETAGVEELGCAAGTPRSGQVTSDAGMPRSSEHTEAHTSLIERERSCFPINQTQTTKFLEPKKSGLGTCFSHRHRHP